MSSLARRFQGTLLAAGILVAALGVVKLSDRWLGAGPPAIGDTPEAIFRFEKEDLVGIRIERPDGVQLVLARAAGEWTLEGSSWKPSRSMVRKVAHQLHDLTARARVVPEAAGDLQRYGLGDKAIRVALTLQDGTILRLEAGDPNPTAVSYYVRTIPGPGEPAEGRIYVVKKSAVDYYRLSPQEFREDRFATLDAEDADAIDATVDGRRILIRRTGDLAWEMVEPAPMAASRDEVRSMLGRVGALRAERFVQDGKDGLERYGLAPPRATIRVGTSSGEPITLWVGDPIPDTEPPLVHVYRAEDDAVYAARAGFLDAFRKPLPEYRNRQLIRRKAEEAVSLSVTRGAESVALTRTADDWRWPDTGPVPGSTPRRVASQAVGLEAAEIHDSPPSGDLGLEPPAVRVDVGFADGEHAVIRLGSRWEIDVDPGVPPPVRPGEPPRPPAPRTAARQWAQLEGSPAIVEIDGALQGVVDDLFREYARRKERDAERSFDVTPAAEPPG